MAVRIITLGQVKVVVDGREKSALPQQRLRFAILVYVAVEGDVARESLLGIFWPDRDPSKARHILSQNIYELRRALGDEAVVAEGDRLRTGPAVEIDAAEFMAKVSAGDVESALGLYTGPFLDSFPLPSTHGFETWVDGKRAQLSRALRKARRERVEGLVESGDVRGALAAARAWSDADRLDDEAQHRTIELLALSGARAEALDRFERYERLMRDELDVAPLDETVKLVERIRNGESSPPDTSLVTLPPLEPRRAVSDAAAREKAPVRRRSGPVRFAVAASVLAALISGAMLVRAIRMRPTPVSAGLPASRSGLDPTRIAVLYFDDHSPNGDLGYLASGLAETLIDELNDVEALSVISRNGVKPYAGTSVSIDSIARALRTGTIVAGSLQRSANTLRVTVDLIDAATGDLLHGATIERPFGELFQLQDDIAHEVSGILRSRVGQEITLRRRAAEASEPEAWILVNRATALAEDIWSTDAPLPPTRLNTAAWALSSADSLLQAAARLDPDWSEPRVLRAWAALGRTKLPGVDTASYNAAIAEGLRVLAPVLERDPVDGPALEARGTLLFRLSRANARREDAESLRDAAQADLQAAVREAPHLARAWSTLSRLLQYAGEIAEANTAAGRALEEDAYLADAEEIHQRLFRTALDLEKFPEAFRWCERGRHDYPDNWRFVECHLALLAFRPGDGPRLDSARAILRHLANVDPPSGLVTPPYRYTYRRVLHTVVLARTDTTAARDSLDAMREYVAATPRLATAFDFDEAHLSLLFGDTAGALDALSRYLDNIPQYRRYVGRSFLFKPLHGNPRFQAITEGQPDRGGAGHGLRAPSGAPSSNARLHDRALVR